MVSSENVGDQHRLGTDDLVAQPKPSPFEPGKAQLILSSDTNKRLDRMVEVTVFSANNFQMCPQVALVH